MYLYILYSIMYRYECTQRLEKHIDFYLAKTILVRLFFSGELYIFLCIIFYKGDGLFLK